MSMFETLVLYSVGLILAAAFIYDWLFGGAPSRQALLPADATDEDKVSAYRQDWYDDFVRIVIAVGLSAGAFALIALSGLLSGMISVDHFGLIVATLFAVGTLLPVLCHLVVYRETEAHRIINATATHATTAPSDTRATAGHHAPRPRNDS